MVIIIFHGRNLVGWVGWVDRWIGGGGDRGCFTMMIQDVSIQLGGGEKKPIDRL